MQFGPVPLSEAEGAVLAHSLSLDGVRLKKGHVLSAEDLALIGAGGAREVIVARLNEGDIGEDAAAEALAHAFTGSNIRAGNASTGRVNLHAAEAGLFRADRSLVDAFNAIDPAITFACLADHSSVQSGEMVATIKIIPLAVSGASLERAISAIAVSGLAHVRTFRPVNAGLIATVLPTLKPLVMDKTSQLLASRLSLSGSKLGEEIRVAHNADAVAGEIVRMARIHEMIVVFGASAVTDPQDVIPAAIRRAGGQVERVGMPVDPGNLLVLGSLGDVSIIGAPGCARSPKENGFDWVLARILAGETPSSMDIAGMGVGGLLKEIPTRPHPRQAAVVQSRKTGLDVAVVLLAAGRASRMGDADGHKLLAAFEGEALIRKMAGTALSSRASQTVVVTGYRSEDIAASLSGLDVELVHNAGFATGMASSLRQGLGALGPEIAGAMILLGDMPALTQGHLNRLIEAFATHRGNAIIRASDGERRGNPVILPRTAFAEAMELAGDVGARALIESGAWPVVDVEIGPAARLDVDTPDAVRAAGGVTEASSQN